MTAFKNLSVDTLETLKQIQDSLMADNLPADDKEITDIEKCIKPNMHDAQEN